MSVSGSAIATLVLFIISIIFVIVPVKIPLPRTKKYHIPIDLRTAPIAAIAILWAAQCIGPYEIRDGIVGQDGIKPYNILILFFSLAYMAITLDISGVLEAAAQWVANKGGRNGRKLYLYFYLLLALISVIVGNDPVILSGTEFLLYYTDTVHLERLAWLIAEFTAANTASMVLFVANPTNVVICEGFGINNVVFSAYTIFPFLGCIVFAFLALAVQFRDKKYVPKLLEEHGYVDARARLKDKWGAIAGSSILGSCLLVIIVVSFFNVDVWKISLPFAVFKLLFDIVWDNYRYNKGILPYKVPQDLAKEDQDEHEHGHEKDSNALKPPTRKSTFDDPSMQSSVDSSSPLVKEKEGENLSLKKETSPPSPRPPPPQTSEDSGLDQPEKPTILKSNRLHQFVERHKDRFYTIYTAFPRLPFALVPFAFSQFILVQALEHQGWIDIFAVWLARASGGRIYPAIWLVGVIGVVLCNVSGTNIGAAILMAKVINATPGFSAAATRASAISLAVSTNIGAVSFTFSASLAGLLWRGIMNKKGYYGISQAVFAYWNLLPITVMTVVGIGIVCIEMAVLYPGQQ